MSREQQGAIIGVGVAVVAAPTATATARTRSNLAAHHLEAAAKAARRVRDIEAENEDAELGNFFSDIMQHASVAVVMAAAALEANANETISDILDGIAPMAVTPEHRELLADLCGGMAGPEEKYRQLALLLDKTPEKGRGAWQDARLLIKLRNDLMHFKPAWADEEVHAKMLAMMSGKLGVSRFYKDGFFYPYGFFTYRTARWSVRTALAFAAYVSALVGVENRFGNPGFNYDLPEHPA